MAVITPPTIVAAPTPPDRADRANFAVRATASFDHLKNHAIPEIQAVAENVALNAADAATSVTLATDQVTLATEQAIIATNKAALAAADSEQTGLDAASTAADRIATAAHRVQTGMDRISTAADHAAVNEALSHLSVGPVTSINGLGGVVTLKTINATPLTGDGDITLITYADYADRATLRSTTAPDGAYRLIESLGMFRFYTGSVELDDDETCFATSTGRWLLELASYDLWSAHNPPTMVPIYARVANTVLTLSVHSQASISTIVPGAQVGDFVAVSAYPSLGLGLVVSSSIPSDGVVTVTVANPDDYHPGSCTASVFNIIVIQAN